MTNYGLKPTFEWLPVDKLLINEQYQRKTTSRASEYNINRITENFNWSKCTPLTVSRNRDETYNVIDGGHRLEAVKRLKGIDSLPCWIIPDADIAAQADSFVGINKDRVVVNSFQIFYAQAKAGDENACRCLKFCQQNDILISRNGSIPNKPNETVALRFFRKNTKKHPQELKFAIGVIRQAFPGLCGQLKNDVLTALLEFRLKNGQGCENNRVIQLLVDTLRSFGDVNIISRQAAAAHATDKQSCQYHFNRIFIDAYKKQMKSKK